MRKIKIRLTYQFKRLTSAWFWKGAIICRIFGHDEESCECKRCGEVLRSNAVDTSL